jgi:SPP1 gp7 family putative phage head morphogenesis protein
MRKRFAAVKRALLLLIVDTDVFGLQPPIDPLALNVGLVGNAQPQAWRFNTDEQKVRLFDRWVKTKMEQSIHEADAAGQPWTMKYIEKAYRQGVTRAFKDSATPKERKEKADFFAGTSEQHLRNVLRKPDLQAKVKRLATRSFEDLEGVSADAARKMNRILANGMARGVKPETIAREMVKQIDGLTKTRAQAIAQTEIVAAHAEGQLDSMEELGVEEVSPLVEWVTADDPCKLCRKMEGALLTIDEARGLIPRHPNCKCSWMPAEMEKKRGRRQAYLKKVNASIKAEGGRKKSVWVGKGAR